jgi:V/A-type H+-transporting ATPase subunit A
MPGEEGYPAYLPSRLAEFYERAGSAIALGKDRRRGSVSVVGAVSPAGGDFSEPVTQYSLRLAGTFWALDSDLARRRHYPAIHWTRSYSLYDMDAWFDEAVAGDWSEHRRWAVELLGQEEELQSIVQLLGLDVLAPAEQLTVAIGRVLREDYLQQSAFSDVDAFCPLEKQYWMLRVIRLAFAVMRETVERGVEVGTVLGVPAMADVARMKLWKADGAAELARDLITRIEGEVDAL